MGAYLSKPGVNNEAGVITIKFSGSSLSGVINLLFSMRTAMLQKVISSTIFGFLKEA